MATQTLPRTTVDTAANNPAASNTNNKLTGGTVSAFRIVVSFLFVCHGLQGFGAFGGIDGAGTAVPFGIWPGWWAGAIELVAGAFVLLGVGTRVAALLCSGAMAYAYFTVHQEVALLPLQNLGEPAALYSWIFLLIAVLGPGPLTVTALVRRLRRG